eukprot:RCo027123
MYSGTGNNAVAGRAFEPMYLVPESQDDLGDTSLSFPDITEPLVSVVPPPRPGTAGGAPVQTRYLTHDLIARLTRGRPLHEVKQLSVTLPSRTEKLRRLENLEVLPNLETLHVNDQCVERIAGLEKLCHLRELSLRKNCLCKIENLTPLFRLEVLDLSHNCIARISANLKDLKLLRVCLLHANAITRLDDIKNLRPCSHLQKLTLYENPLSAVEHYRSYTTFFLSQLHSLDDVVLTDEDRQLAVQRWERAVVDDYEQQLQELQTRSTDLQSTLQQKEALVEKLDRRNRELAATVEFSREKMSAMEQEVSHTKALLEQRSVQLAQVVEALHLLMHSFRKLHLEITFMGDPVVPPQARSTAEAAVGSSVPVEDPHIPISTGHGCENPSAFTLPGCPDPGVAALVNGALQLVEELRSAWMAAAGTPSCPGASDPSGAAGGKSILESLQAPTTPQRGESSSNGERSFDSPLRDDVDQPPRQIAVPMLAEATAAERDFRRDGQSGFASARVLASDSAPAATSNLPSASPAGGSAEGVAISWDIPVANPAKAVLLPFSAPPSPTCCGGWHGRLTRRVESLCALQERMKKDLVSLQAARQLLYDGQESPEHSVLGFSGTRGLEACPEDLWRRLEQSEKQKVALQHRVATLEEALASCREGAPEGELPQGFGGFSRLEADPTEPLRTLPNDSDGQPELGRAAQNGAQPSATMLQEKIAELSAKHAELLQSNQSLGASTIEAEAWLQRILEQGMAAAEINSAVLSSVRLLATQARPAAERLTVSRAIAAAQP